MDTHQGRDINQRGYEIMKITDFTQERSNFWRSKDGKKSYRLFAHGITPNGCWLIAPKMVELVDIDIATGNNIYGQELVFQDAIGTVSGSYNFITY